MTTKQKNLTRRARRGPSLSAEALVRLAQIGLVLDVQKGLHLVRALCIGRLKVRIKNDAHAKELYTLFASFDEIDDQIDAGLAALALEAFRQSEPKRRRK